jgi:hypothetical protein
MSEMEVDIVGPAGMFGRLRLPEVITKSSGTDIIIAEQEIKISNMEAFIAYVKALMNDEAMIMRLENGHATIRAFWTKSNIIYAKDVHLKCMNGPKTVMKTTVVNGDGSFVNTMVATNPSPLEIDLGTVRHELRNGKGEKIAEQKGKVYFMRGETEYVMTGTVSGREPEGEVRIIGLGVEEDNWNNHTIPFLDIPVPVTEEFTALCKSSVQAG